MQNSYWRALLFGSIIPCLIVAAGFAGFYFFGSGWIPLITLLLGMYSLPFALIITMLISLLGMRGHKYVVQIVTGLLLCAVCIGITAWILDQQ